MDVKLEVDGNGSGILLADAAITVDRKSSDREDNDGGSTFLDSDGADKADGSSLQEPADFLNAPLLSVRCGGNRAHLIRDKFLCPGIHHKCIEFNGELVSPKEFTVISGKSKQKDWKGSIRIGKCTLRSLMENNYMDFHDHSTQCSGKCQSRGGNMLISSSKANKDETSSQIFEGTVPTMVQSSSAYDSIAATLSSLLATNTNDSSNWNRTTDSDPTLSSSSPSVSDPLKASDVLDGGFGISIPMPPLLGPAEHNSTPFQRPNQLESLMFTKPHYFWTTVLDIGMYDELVNEIISNIYQLKNSFKTRMDMRPKISQQLSDMVNLLGVSKEIDNKVKLKRMVQRAEGDKLSFQIEELRRKTEEHKLRQQMARKRTELFDQLVCNPNIDDDERFDLVSNEDSPLKMPRNEPN